MAMPFQPWRAAMLPASFRGAEFKVEVSGQAGGRRNALHEFPKRDVPFAEDMGRKARHWPVTAYIIGPDYTAGRDALIEACEQEGPGTLVHPTLGTVQVNCDVYATQELRERGGICIFELGFVEAGSPASDAITADSQSQVGTAATNSDVAAGNSLNTSLGGSGGIGSDAVVASAAIPSATAAGSGGIGRN